MKPFPKNRNARQSRCVVLKLRRTRDSLLPRLLSGQMEVKTEEK